MSGPVEGPIFMRETYWRRLVCARSTSRGPVLGAPFGASFTRETSLPDHLMQPPQLPGAVKAAVQIGCHSPAIAGWRVTPNQKGNVMSP